MTKLSSEETEAKMEKRIPRFWNTNFQEKKSQQMELGPNPQRSSPRSRKSHLNPDIALWFRSSLCAGFPSSSRQHSLAVPGPAKTCFTVLEKHPLWQTTGLDPMLSGSRTATHSFKFSTPVPPLLCKMYIGLATQKLQGTGAASSQI